MSTSNAISGRSKPQFENELDLKGLLELLIKHFDIHEGLFDLSINFHIGTGAVGGPSKDAVLPGVIFGFGGVGLKRVDKVGPNTLDASTVNPRKKKRAKAKSKSKRK